LSYGGRSEILSPIDHAIAEKLVAHFDRAVEEHQLVEHAWPRGDGSATALRVHIYRIRKRIAPLGLSISALRGRGYIMTTSASRAKADPETIT
jgi:DNA-binding response OmpR family regulator